MKILLIISVLIFAGCETPPSPRLSELGLMRVGDLPAGATLDDAVRVWGEPDAISKELIFVYRPKNGLAPEIYIIPEIPDDFTEGMDLAPLRIRQIVESSGVVLYPGQDSAESKE